MMIKASDSIFVFEALGAQLESLTRDPIEVVSRPTRDVDVLAVARPDPAGVVLLTADPLPEALAEVARRVGRDLGLPADWLNPGPTGLLTGGLPEGFTARLHRRAFGERLVVHFIRRFDQICFKLYAAVNGSGPRHLADLNALSPTQTEVTEAARWILTQDAGPQFPEYVRSFFQTIGYADVADTL